MRRSIVKEQELHELAEQINEILWTDRTTCVGQCRIGMAYGGYRLEEVLSEGGSIKVRFDYDTKRGLRDKMSAFLTGMLYGRNRDD